MTNNEYKKFRDLADEIYDRGFKDGHKDGVTSIDIDQESYVKGLNDAWECARKIANREDEMREIFHDIAPTEIFMKSSASEAICKIKMYEARQRCVKYTDKKCSIINDFCAYPDGECYECPLNYEVELAKNRVKQKRGDINDESRSNQ